MNQSQHQCNTLEFRKHVQFQLRCMNEPMRAEVFLKATKVDGIYDSDPKKNPDAKRFAQITYIDALQRQLKVMDSTAFSLCMDNKMPIIVFDSFREHNLKRVVMGEKVGTLVTACSSGEEPYSIAMLLDDVLGISPWEIVATDLNTRVLDMARRGQYPMERMSEIPKNYLSKYCLKGVGSQDGTLLIERKLRERIQFKQHNLNEAPPKLAEFDVIFLRNVMIYFDQNTKRQVVSRLLTLLRSGGYFLIGHSETLNGVNDDVRLIQPSIYQGNYL